MLNKDEGVDTIADKITFAILCKLAEYKIMSNAMESYSTQEFDTLENDLYETANRILLEESSKDAR